MVNCIIKGNTKTRKTGKEKLEVLSTYIHTYIYVISITIKLWSLFVHHQVACWLMLYLHEFRLGLCWYRSVFHKKILFFSFYSFFFLIFTFFFLSIFMNKKNNQNYLLIIIHIFTLLYFIVFGCSGWEMVLFQVYRFIINRVTKEKLLHYLIYMHFYYTENL